MKMQKKESFYENWIDEYIINNQIFDYSLTKDKFGNPGEPGIIITVGFCEEILIFYGYNVKKVKATLLVRWQNLNNIEFLGIC